MRAGKCGTVLESRYVLYGTSGCHLCELAQDLLEKAGRARELSWRQVDIAQDDVLVERYGESIPVLRDERDGRELQWPFSLLDLMRWLR